VEYPIDFVRILPEPLIPETRRMRMLTLAAVALAALPALADRPECRWSKSWDEALAEAKERNVPIMVTFHKDN
jgi:hypothetical protein